MTKKPAESTPHPSSSVQDRRRFIKQSAAAVAATSVAGGFFQELPAAQSTSANNLLKIMCVGTGNRALANISGVEAENIVALCDVDTNYLDRAKSKFKDAATYRDYREMIAEESDKADAIVIATADHNHAPASIRAINANLHCYCEKPLTHTVQEARKVAEAAAAKGLVTQMGTQIHAGDNYRRVVEIVQAGTLGDIKEVHVWVGKGWGGGDWPENTERQPPEAPEPGICGSVRRSGATRTLRDKYHPAQVATLVGFWPGHAGRHGLSLHGPAVLGARSTSPRFMRSDRSRGAPGDLPAGVAGQLRVSRRGQGQSEVHLVRRKPNSERGRRRESPRERRDVCRNRRPHVCELWTVQTLSER